MVLMTNPIPVHLQRSGELFDEIIELVPGADRANGLVHARRWALLPNAKLRGKGEIDAGGTICFLRRSGRDDYLPVSDSGLDFAVGQDHWLSDLILIHPNAPTS